MSELHRVWLSRHQLAAGETLVGKVVFEGANADKLSKVKAVRLIVRAKVSGSGTSEDVVVLDRPLKEGPVVEAELPFEVALPAAGPVSWPGRYVKIEWEVVAELDIPWAFDPRDAATFTVTARGA